MAADVTGNWTGEFNGPDGNGMKIVFHFKQDGAKLTGSVDGPGGHPLEIQDGKVEGDKLSFIIHFAGGNGDMKIAHSGTVSGNEITLEIKMDGAEGGPGGPIKLKRS